MKKLFLQLLFCTSLASVNAQTCRDSVAQLLYYGKNFYGGATFFDVDKTLVDKWNNIYLNWQQPIPNQKIDEFTFFKINPSGKIIQKKGFQVTNDNDYWNIPSFINSKNELLYVGQYYGIGNPASPSPCVFMKILCMDTSGKKIWAKKYESDLGFFIGSSATEGKNNEVIVAPLSSSGVCAITTFTTDFQLIKFNEIGQVLFAKRYRIVNLSGFQNNNTSLQTNVQLSGNTILLAGGFSYEGQTDPTNTKDGFFLSKIDYASGKQLLTKSFTFTNNAHTPYRFTLKHINYDTASKQILVVAREISYESRLFLMLLDENLNIVKVKRLVSGVPEAANNYNHKEVIRQDNTIAICNKQNNDFSVTYTMIDKNLEIIKHQKIKLFPYYGRYADFAFDPFFDNNGSLRIRVNDIFTSLSNKMLLLNTSDEYNTQTLCNAYDTTFYKPEPAYAKEIQTFFWSGDLPPLRVTDAPLSPAEEFEIQTTEVCKRVSICTDIKIYGQKKYCLPDKTGTFTAKINGECIRNIVWSFDTTALRINRQLNDTLLQLEFIKPYKGFIYASLNGCSLKDSIEVEVNAPKKAIDLGKDTILCPNEHVVLYAGSGFVHYRWQDGTTTETMNVQKPGTYWLQATDSCGFVYSDTVNVLPQPYEWQVPLGLTICKDDTAAVWLNPLFSRLQINPTQTWTLQKDSLLFYPSQTTVYTLEAVSQHGCKLNNTLTVTVNNCPVAIFFPNAFSPNGDGVNDVFKPFVDGPIISYELRIFNRWGQIVFETNRYTSGWNGVFNGNKMPIGNYSWHCRYRFKNKNPVSRKGNLLLIN